MYDFDDYVKYVIDKDIKYQWRVTFLVVGGHIFGTLGVGAWFLWDDGGFEDWFLENLGEPSIVLFYWFVLGTPIFYLLVIYLHNLRFPI